jgi:hypothetical protein
MYISSQNYSSIYCTVPIFFITRSCFNFLSTDTHIFILTSHKYILLLFSPPFVKYPTYLVPLTPVLFVFYSAYLLLSVNLAVLMHPLLGLSRQFSSIFTDI